MAIIERKDETNRARSTNKKMTDCQRLSFSANRLGFLVGVGERHKEKFKGKGIVLGGRKGGL